MSDDLNLDGMTSSRREINRFKITEGSHIFRVLPPFGTNHNNVPSRQVQLHWGFQKKDGGQSPLPCSYPSEGYCPICERVKELEQLAERAKAQGNNDEATEIAKDAGRIKVRRTYLLNAANKQGEVGILELTKTSIDALIALMKQYINKYGKNPTGLTTGCWFVFSRSGKGFNTNYTVEFHKTMLTLQDGDQVEKVDVTALSPNVVENYEKLAYDIHKMYTPVSSSDLGKILGGMAVDEVIVKQQKPQGGSDAAKPAAKPAEQKTANAAAKPAATKAAKPAAKPAPAPEPAADEDVDDIMSILNS